MKVEKANTISQFPHPQNIKTPEDEVFLWEDGDSRCMWSHFYVQAVEIHKPAEEHRMIYSPETYDFTYKYSFYYIYSGTGLITREWEDDVTLEAGKLYIVNRLVLRDIRTNGDPSFSYIDIASCGSLLDNLFAMLGITESVLVLEGREAKEQMDLAVSLLTDIHEGAPMQTNYEKVAAILFGLLLAATEKKRRNTYAASDAECRADPVVHAKAWVDTFFAKDIRINDLAEKAHYSPAHLSKMFKSRYGIPLMKYVMQKRVSYAKTILETTETPISLIAASMHFSNTQHFINTFKAQVGVTPAKYREAHSRVLKPKAPSEPLF